MRTIRYGSRGAEVTRLQELLGVHADGRFGTETEAALKAKQAELGLEADGVAGPRTWAGLGLAPPPPTKAELHAHYGPLRPGIEYDEGKKGRILPRPGWVERHIEYVQLHDGRKRLFNKKAGKLFTEAFAAACKASGHTPESVQTTVFRHILWDKDEELSEHSYGTAVDFDPQANYRGAPPGRAELDKHPRFVAEMKRAGFKWGGDWKGKSRDPMHFELEILVG